MTPVEFKDHVVGWVRAFREIATEVLPDRDSKLWSTLASAGSALAALAFTNPSAFPPGWADRIVFWSGVATVFAAKMGWAWGSSPKGSGRRGVSRRPLPRGARVGYQADTMPDPQTDNRGNAITGP